MTATPPPLDLAAIKAEPVSPTTVRSVDPLTVFPEWEWGHLVGVREAPRIEDEVAEALLRRRADTTVTVTRHIWGTVDAEGHMIGHHHNGACGPTCKR